MQISLKLLTSLIVSLIVIIVGGSCLGVSLGTTVAAINSVGEAWARGISRSVSENVKTYFEGWENTMVSGLDLIQRNNLSLPSDDFRANKSNWTDTIVPWFLQTAASVNYSFSVLAAAFRDESWAFSSTAADTVPNTAAWTIQWMENLHEDPVAGMSVGGFRYLTENMSKTGWTAASNYSPTVLISHAGSLRYGFDRNPILTYLGYRAAAKPAWVKPTMLYFPPTHIWIDTDDRKLAWETYAILRLERSDGTILGTLTTGFDMEGETRNLLVQSKKSPNGALFFVAPDGSVLSTTRPEKSWTSVISTVDAFVPPHCSTTLTVLPYQRPPRIGCLFTTDQYPYPPLNAVGKSFATTDSFAFDFFKVDGKVYAIAAERVTTEVGGLKHNVVTILPEEDLYLGQVNSSIALSVGLAVVVAVVAIGIALLLLHLLVRRLEAVQTKMLAVSNLENLDAEETMDDNNNISGTTDDENPDNVIEEFGNASKNKIVGRKQQRKQQAKGVEDRSWIAEVAHLEDAYAETVRSMTNFTRYVSRAVVSELIIQRKMTMAKRERKEPLPGAIDDDDDDDENPHSEQSRNRQTTTTSAAIVADGSHRQKLLEANIEENVASEYDVTVLMTEIQGFSSQIWATNPENHDGVLYILHIYFKRMCRLIMGHGGVVDKFLGDSIMSYWGAPVRTEHHALLATLAALSLVRESRRDPLKKIFAQTLKREVKLRCGLSSGTAIVGTFGNAECVNYSIVGAPVTQARYVQGFNKYWHTTILMDGPCMRKVGDVVVNRLICQVQFLKDGPAHFIYEVMGLNPDSKQVRDTLSSDLRTIAFTDVLSLPTINSNNQGVEEILHTTSPEHASTVSSLLSWHGKGRTVVPRSYVEFAEKFSDAIRAMIECRFVDAYKALNELLSFRLMSATSTLSQLQKSSSLDSPLQSNAEAARTTSNGGSGNLVATNNNNNNNDIHVMSNNNPADGRPQNNASASSSQARSSTSLIEDLDFPFRFSIDDDMVIKMSIDISKLYLKKAPPKIAIDETTGTFFIRAHKLDGLISADDNNNNNNNVDNITAAIISERNSRKSNAAAATSGTEKSDSKESKRNKSVQSSRPGGNNNDNDDDLKERKSSSRRSNSSSSNHSSASTRESSSPSSTSTKQKKPKEEKNRSESNQRKRESKEKKDHRRHRRPTQRDDENGNAKNESDANSSSSFSEKE